MNRLRSALAMLCLVCLLAGISLAQDLIKAAREDGAQMLLRVYVPSQTGCAPLALISPGAGGSEEGYGYSYLARALQDDGWRVIVMGHRESGSAALRSAMQQTGGLKEGVTKLVNDPAMYNARLMDITAALKWASTSCKAPFVALLGHSMGARTVMVESGAKNNLGVNGLDRFDAYVTLSPDGPGPMFPDKSWSDVHKPVLLLTGTNDASLEGDWQTRTIFYDTMPAGCHWLGVIDGATHLNFAGIGMAEKTEKLTLLETKAFLDALRGGKCGTPIQAEGISVKSK